MAAGRENKCFGHGAVFPRECKKENRVSGETEFWWRGRSQLMGSVINAGFLTEQSGSLKGGGMFLYGPKFRNTFDLNAKCAVLC